MGIAEKLAGWDVFLSLITYFGQEIQRSGSVDLFDAAVFQIEGQRDPRCLLKAAEVVSALGRLPQSDPPSLPNQDRQGHASSSGGVSHEEIVHELFDVLSMYFPVTLRATPGMELDVGTLKVRDVGSAWVGLGREGKGREGKGTPISVWFFWGMYLYLVPVILLNNW